MIFHGYVTNNQMVYIYIYSVHVEFKLIQMTESSWCSVDWLAGLSSLRFPRLFGYGISSCLTPGHPMLETWHDWHFSTSEIPWHSKMAVMTLTIYVISSHPDSWVKPIFIYVWCPFALLNLCVYIYSYKHIYIYTCIYTYVYTYT